MDVATSFRLWRSNICAEQKRSQPRASTAAHLAAPARHGGAFRRV
jgi:hypothetical protein